MSLFLWFLTHDIPQLSIIHKASLDLFGVQTKVLICLVIIWALVGAIEETLRGKLGIKEDVQSKDDQNY